MARLIDVPITLTLDDYESVAHLAPAVHRLRAEAETDLPRLEGRTVWMVNSTPVGGGVAEMLPTMIALLRDLGIDTRWMVIDSDDEEFFRFTKGIHNRIHGEATTDLSEDDRPLFEAVNRENAHLLIDGCKDGDILIVHDPQPLPIAGFVREHVDVRTIWRCHIGLDEETEVTRGVWKFLRPYLETYDHAVFSAPDYIPGYFMRRSSIVHPSLDPLSDKNRPLHFHQVVGILVNSGLVEAPGPVLTPAYEKQAARLGTDGEFGPATADGDFGLLTRPLVTQVSRWDRLKGFEPLLEGFVRLKRRLESGALDVGGLERRRLDLVRLVLAGPEPASIQDDPEAVEVLDRIRDTHTGLDPGMREQIGIFALPMASRRENALAVNALQRASSIVVQNSLREGFGLTVSEAMWKAIPILTNTRACGPRIQIRDRVDGRLIDDPADPDAIGNAIEEMLRDVASRRRWGRNAQRRVHEQFLIFTQLCAWLEVFEKVID